ncbi:CRISPR-associated helicase Cas3' [Calidifontibacillus oryziterrae]|uniref:CRISPR-associated helicase Cas3' n=1 Tax=Calidifontibacillus oryziterrae TaxID=1191699 RepID=UPI0003056359|nr:CRISPR-associated helicase Cas3' [Calidifontibacillus oryziterrae]
MENSFKQLTGHNPYPFQLQAIQEILDNEKYIITASTGSGKTWMSIFPFIYAKENNIAFADRMFYVLPQRTLVTSVADVIKPILAERSLKVTIQMGGQNEDPYFEGDVIVTTIDQLLAAYLGVSYGTSRNGSNIAPGAILGSYIVLDEFHLLEVDKSLATYIDMINYLSPFVRTCMMTATATEKLLEALANKINGRYQMISGQEIVDLQMDLNAVRLREVFWNEAPISVEEITKKHQDRTLVVVNTVKKAQKLYKELNEHLRSIGENNKIVCLHARFLKNHRNKLESEILETLKRNSNKEMIVIANQVVEVGLDISATVLITELCPANSLIQRMGRCERYGESIGKVFVHELEGSSLPYDSNLVNRTKDYLMENAPIIMTAIEESQMVEMVHSNNEEELLNKISFSEVRKIVAKTQIEGHRSHIKELIRDVDNIQVIIHPKPWELDLYKKPEYFSIPYRTIINALRKIENLDGLVFNPEFPEDIQNKYSKEVKWKPLKDIKSIHNYSFISLSPQIASYCKNIGFKLDQAGEFTSKETVDEIDKRKRFSYKNETYLEHAMDVRVKIRSRDEEYTVFSNQVQKALNNYSISLNELAEFVGALHDAGKLLIDNVLAYQNWQQEIIGDITNEYLAHTDFDANNHYHVQKEKEAKFKRVPHAAEGACAVLPILMKVVGDLNVSKKLESELFLAMFTAIKRHHGAYVNQVKEYSMVSDASKIILKTLEGFSLNVVSLNEKFGLAKATQYSKYGVNPSEYEFGWPLYWYFSRRLRLADQLSQQEKI